MYYIYILKNPITKLPFYVGVGKENRQSSCSREQQHINEAIKFSQGKRLKHPNKHKFNTILQIQKQGLSVEIEITSKFQDEKSAFIEEQRLIALYGRRDLKTGILTNLTSGGEGCVNQSEETKAKRRQTLKGRVSPSKGLKFGSYSKERCDNISKSCKGRIPWNKGKKGLQKAWNKGIKMTAEQRKNMGPPKGRIPWNKGIKHNITSN